MVDLMRVDHVAIGGDLDDWELLDVVHRSVPGLIDNRHIGVPKGSTLIDSPHTLDQYPVIAESLVKRGYADEDIRKILGGDWLRIYKEVIG
jgi:membrane dipeptidase